MILRDARVRAFLYVCALVLIVAACVWFNHVFDKAARYDKKAAELTVARDSFREYVRLEKVSDAKRDAASQGYQNEIRRLQSDPRPIPVVRVCKPARAEHLPAPAGGAPGSQSATATAGVLSGTTGKDTQGRDIGPALAELLDRADLLSAQTRGLLALTGE
jgi:hypothetical protein